MIATRYDVTEVLAARRRTRPPTWLFVAGIVTGWVVTAAAAAFTVHVGAGVLAAVAVGVVGYFVVPVPIVTGLRTLWLQQHRDRADELDRQLGDQVPALRSWVDARLGEAAGLPPDLATMWLLAPEPRSVRDLLALPPEVGLRMGGAALTARHEHVDGRTLLRLGVLPNAAIVADGPEPPPPHLSS